QRRALRSQFEQRTAVVMADENAGGIRSLRGKEREATRGLIASPVERQLVADAIFLQHGMPDKAIGARLDAPAIGFGQRLDPLLRSVVGRQQAVEFEARPRASSLAVRVAAGGVALGLHAKNGCVFGEADAPDAAAGP